MTEKKNRSFKVKEVSDTKAYGRYTGDSPYQAANKALSELIRRRKKAGKSTTSKINFTLIESTKGSKHRQHQYTGKRLKLKVPITYETKEGTVVEKKYKNQLRKIKKAELKLKATAVKK